MQINLLAFGIARDILGSSQVTYEASTGLSVAELKQKLTDDYPEFSRLRHLAIAVNCNYVDETTVLSENDEVVIIPPVSGG